MIKLSFFITYFYNPLKMASIQKPKIMKFDFTIFNDPKRLTKPARKLVEDSDSDLNSDDDET